MTSHVDWNLLESIGKSGIQPENVGECDILTFSRKVSFDLTQNDKSANELYRYSGGAFVNMAFLLMMK
jgi:hypothetical protein